MIQLPELKKDTISMLNKYDSLNIFVKNFLLNKITESVEVPQSQIEGEINTLLVQYKIKDESELIKWLAKSNKTKDDLSDGSMVESEYDSFEEDCEEDNITDEEDKITNKEINVTITKRK